MAEPLVYENRTEPLSGGEIRELVWKTGRPVVVRGDRAVLARPVERVLELLDGSA